MKKVLLLLAKGSEELEAISVINLLRRAKLNCTIAAVDGHCEKDGLVTCSQGTRILADTLLSQTDPKSFDALVLPGGMEGAKTFSKDVRVQGIIKEMYASKKLITAICAAPMALNHAGILTGHQVTSYPGLRGEVEGTNVHYVDGPAAVVHDGMIITSRGPGTALAFALTIIEALVGKGESDLVAKQLLLDHYPIKH